MSHLEWFLTPWTLFVSPGLEIMKALIADDFIAGDGLFNL